VPVASFAPSFIISRAVDRTNELVPRCTPRPMRPSLRYCSMGRRIRSATPEPTFTIDRMGDTPEMTSASWFALTSGVQISCKVVDSRVKPETWSE